MDKLKEALVKVITSKGAFSSEVAVQIQSLDGSQVSLFADKDNIKTDEGVQYLKVYLVVNNILNNEKRLLLPSESFETSSRWLDVDPHNVKELAAV